MPLQAVIVLDTMLLIAKRFILIISVPFSLYLKTFFKYRETNLTPAGATIYD